MSVVISARKMLTVCDVKNLLYIDTICQSISIYGYFVTSLSAKSLRADISSSLASLSNDGENIADALLFRLCRLSSLHEVRRST